MFQFTQWHVKGPLSEMLHSPPLKKNLKKRVGPSRHTGGWYSAFGAQWFRGNSYTFSRHYVCRTPVKKEKEKKYHILLNYIRQENKQAPSVNNHMGLVLATCYLDSLPVYFESGSSTAQLTQSRENSYSFIPVE